MADPTTIAQNQGTEIAIGLVQIHDSATFMRIGGRMLNGVKLPFLPTYPTRTGMVSTRAFQQPDGQLLVRLFKGTVVVAQVLVPKEGWSIDTAVGF